MAESPPAALRPSKSVKRASSASTLGRSFAERQKAAEEHAKVVAAARESVERAEEEKGEALLRAEEEKLGEIESRLAARSAAKWKEHVARQAKLAGKADKVREEAQRQKARQEELREAQKAEDAKYFTRRDAKAKAHRDMMANRHKLGLASSAPSLKQKDAFGTVRSVSLRELVAASEPGPTTLDNRFYDAGDDALRILT